MEVQEVSMELQEESLPISSEGDMVGCEAQPVTNRIKVDLEVHELIGTN